MSRSRKKNLFLTIAGSSNKEDRTLANRKMRRENAAILRGLLPENEEETTFVNLRDVSDTWDFGSDGLAMYVGKRDFTPIQLHKFFGK